MKVQAPSWRGPSEFDWFHLHYDRKSYRTLVKICLFGISKTIKRWWLKNIWLKYQYMNKYFRDKWWFLIFKILGTWLLSDMISGHNQGGIGPTPTAPTSWGPELSYKTIRFPVTLLQIVKIAAKVKHLWKVKLMKNQKMLNLCKNGFYHWNQGSMDFQIKCRSNKISKMSKFKKLVGNSPFVPVVSGPTSYRYIPNFRPRLAEGPNIYLQKRFFDFLFSVKII